MGEREKEKKSYLKHLFLCLFVHVLNSYAFNTYLLSTYYMPDSLFDVGDAPSSDITW